MPMIKTSTKNELVRFLYKESKEKQNTEIENALLIDNELVDELVQMENLRKELDRFRVKAPKRTIDNILDYSRTYMAG